MNKEFVIKFWPVIVLVAALFAAAVAFRPVLPIDETRYLTVSWELFLHHDYSLPTLNFEPYHHKPPLLFFLIDTAWDIFGVARWTALVPFFIFALAHIFMTRALARRLFPDNIAAQERLPYLSVASFPFLIYSTIIMFDVMLTVFVLGFFLAAFSYLNKPTLWKLVLGGICLGLGGMTKGPVVLIYTFLPLALLAVWEKKSGIERTRGVWVKWFGASFVIGLALVMVWLLDLLFETGPEFFHTLLFTQTIDRINGKMESSHARPFYFYLPLLPVLFLPWLCFPAVWKNAKAVLGRLKTDTGMKFLLLWFAGCAIVFMLISGKQPHYLVPLLPPVLIFMALCLEKVNLKAIKMTALAMVVLVCADRGGQSRA